MVEIIPTVQGRAIRTYTNVEAWTDTDSEDNKLFEADLNDSTDSEGDDVATRLKKNQEFMDRQLKLPAGPKHAMVTVPQPRQSVKAIKKTEFKK